MNAGPGPELSACQRVDFDQDQSRRTSCFSARLLRPAKLLGDELWAFVVLPREASERLPRRGRTSVEGTLDGYPFHATLEPDGKLSHWLQIGAELLKTAGAGFGDIVRIEIRPMAQEPKPAVPADLRAALATSPEASATWDDTTTIARLDWIHWITSAKQARTRLRRIQDARQMLASGKRRVCCFDPSGYYSKAFGAPEAAE